ncbi:LOW QUALITY PROTEIN: reverse transcriptase [Phytophthora megakarya]|uniref:Reverse transcriptase n=1 Tax=Phytophthora megakarya TaxID=4795 RepID=A0A225VUF3_9STRA|nr:LOW QUALITY PROTEIN: reverse transcriptase [Phytophthora megakarya]
MRQAVWMVANVQQRAVMQPGCTEQGAIKPGLMTRARGYKDPPAEHSFMAGPGQNASDSGIHLKKRRRKHTTLRKSQSGTETLHGVSAGQTQVPKVAVETLNVLTRACTGYQYKKMELENPPTDMSELTSLPVMSWKRFAKDLF